MGLKLPAREPLRDLGLCCGCLCCWCEAAGEVGVARTAAAAPSVASALVALADWAGAVAGLAPSAPFTFHALAELLLERRAASLSRLLRLAPFPPSPPSLPSWLSLADDAVAADDSAPAGVELSTTTGLVASSFTTLSLCSFSILIIKCAGNLTKINYKAQLSFFSVDQRGGPAFAWASGECTLGGGKLHRSQAEPKVRPTPLTTPEKYEPCILPMSAPLKTND